MLVADCVFGFRVCGWVGGLRLVGDCAVRVVVLLIVLRNFYSFVILICCFAMLFSFI